MNYTDKAYSAIIILFETILFGLLGIRGNRCHGWPPVNTICDAIAWRRCTGALKAGGKQAKKQLEIKKIQHLKKHKFLDTF